MRTLVLFLSTNVLVFENSAFVDLAVGRSTVRQRILALLMSESSGRLHLREIQRRAETSPGTASRELAKLVAAGLIHREAEGNQVYFRVSTEPFATMLRSLLVAIPAPQFQPRPPSLRETGGTAPQPASAAAAASTAGTVSGAPVGIDSAAAGEHRADENAEQAPAGQARIVRDVEPNDVPSSVETPPRVYRHPIAAPGLPAEQAAEPRNQPSSEMALETVNPGSAGPSAPAAGSAGTAATIARSPDRLGLEVAGRLSDALRPLYGDSLCDVYLYGPRAAGPAPADSDVETIVVLDRVDSYGAELERTSQICSALSHELNLVVSRVFVDQASWNGGTDGLIPPIRGEAVAV